jgi:hypothetical protein
MPPACSHLDQITLDHVPATIPGCEDCLRMGGWWVHLRLCLSCGHIGCCDSSPNRHASHHAHDSGHVIIRSVEPGEDWSWCFADQVGLQVNLPVHD